MQSSFLHAAFQVPLHLRYKLAQLGRLIFLVPAASGKPVTSWVPWAAFPASVINLLSQSYPFPSLSRFISFPFPSCLMHCTHLPSSFNVISMPTDSFFRFVTIIFLPSFFFVSIFNITSFLRGYFADDDELTTVKCGATEWKLEKYCSENVFISKNGLEINFLPCWHGHPYHDPGSTTDYQLRV